MMSFFKSRGWWWWTWRLTFAALVLGLAASWREGGRLCASANQAVPIPAGLAVETVSFRSGSGCTISGWLIKGPTNRPVVVLQHGVRADKRTLLSRAKFLAAAGYTVLMFDFQAHGESPGKIITFGYLESRDSQAAVEYIRHRFPGRPIGVIGVSLGGAAAVLADPPLEVQAMILEMVYPTIEEATKDRIEIRLGPPGRLLSPLLTAQIPRRAGCSASELRPIEQTAKLTVPKLFMAGTLDRETKFAEARRLYDTAAEPKQFVAFEGASHQDLHDFAPAIYEPAALKFLETYLK